MVLTFAALPPHIQLSALKKLDFKEYVRFNRCSTRSVSISKALTYKFSLHVTELWVSEEFPIRTKFKIIDNGRHLYYRLPAERMESLNCRIVADRFRFLKELEYYSNERYFELAQQLKSLAIEVSELECAAYSTSEINLSIFNELVKTVKVKNLKIAGADTTTFADYENIPDILKLEIVDFRGIVPFDLISELPVKLLVLSGPQEHFTPELMNGYLRNHTAEHLWMLAVKGQFEEENDPKLLKDLDATQIWKVPKPEGWNEETEEMSDLRQMPCRAYASSSGGIQLLVYVGMYFFYSRRLTCDTQEELRQQALDKLEEMWKVLEQAQVSHPMPPFFSSLTPHLQLSAIKKSDFKDYICFDACSKRSHSIAKAVKCKLPLYISQVLYEFPLKIVAVTDDGNRFELQIETVATSNCRIVAERIGFQVELDCTEKYLEISKQMRSIRIGAPELECIFHSDYVVNLSIFNETIDVLNIKHLDILGLQHMTFSNYRHLPAFPKLDHLQLGGTVPIDLFSELRVKNLKIQCVQEHFTPELMNAYLKNPSAEIICLNAADGQFEEETDHILLRDLTFTQIKLVPTLNGWREGPFDPTFFPGRAYVVFNVGKGLFVNVEPHNFVVHQLGSGSEEELRQQGLDRLLKLHSRTFRE